MAMRRSASRVRRNRAPDGRPAEHVYGVPVPDGLHEAIEIERGNLARAESLLGCLAISLEYGADSADQPYYPDVAQLARELVRRSINGLDSLTLQQRLLRDKIEEGLCSWSLGAYPDLDPPRFLYTDGGAGGFGGLCRMRSAA